MRDKRQEQQNPAAGLRRPVTIGIFGFYGNENLGDEAIIEATVYALRERFDDVQIVCFSVNPADSAARYAVPAFPIIRGSKRSMGHRRRMELEEAELAAARADQHQPAASTPGKSHRIKRRLKRNRLVVRLVTTLRSIRSALLSAVKEVRFIRECGGHLREVDLFIVAGSNQFLDNFGGAWRFPYTLFRWTWLAKRKRIPVIMLSVGAGPIFSRFSRWLIRRAIGRARYVSFRDRGSPRLLGFDPHTVKVYPDLAFTLPVFRTEITPVVKPADRLVIAINPMAVHAKGYWYKEDAKKYAAYVGKLGAYVQGLAAAGQPFVLFANQPRDERVIRDVMGAATALGAPSALLEQSFRQSHTVTEYMRILSEADLVVATRFHATVLALRAGKPVIGLCYYRKSAELLSEFGQQDYVLDVDGFTTAELDTRTRLLTSRCAEEAATIQRQAKAYRTALAEQMESALRNAGVPGVGTYGERIVTGGSSHA